MLLAPHSFCADSSFLESHRSHPSLALARCFIRCQRRWRVTQSPRCCVRSDFNLLHRRRSFICGSLFARLSGSPSHIASFPFSLRRRPSTLHHLSTYSHNTTNYYNNIYVFGRSATLPMMQQVLNDHYYHNCKQIRNFFKICECVCVCVCARS